MDSGLRRRIAVIGLMVVAITLMIWAGVHNARERRRQQQEQDSARVMLIPDKGEAAAADDGSNPAPKLQGKPAPGFTLVDLEGKKVSLSDFRGKPVLVNLWATWCGPCKLEMPWFQEFSQKYAGQGLVILGVAADDAGKTAIASTAKKLGVTYPILLKDDKIEDAYGGADYIPESFYVDRSGKVMLATAGISDGGQGGKDEIEANIKRLIATGGD